MVAPGTALGELGVDKVDPCGVKVNARSALGLAKRVVAGDVPRAVTVVVRPWVTALDAAIIDPMEMTKVVRSNLDFANLTCTIVQILLD